MGRLYGRRFVTRRQAMDEVIDWKSASSKTTFANLVRKTKFEKVVSSVMAMPSIAGLPKANGVSLGFCLKGRFKNA